MSDNIHSSTDVLLIGAFEPFGGRRDNRAERAARRLIGARIGDARVEIATLPVVFARLDATVRALLARRPRALVLVGESHLARRVLIERLALNLADARAPDNAGERPRDVEVIPGAPLALATRVDVGALAEAVRRGGVDCAVSAHAGTFCCNAAYFIALQHSAPGGPPVVFVHVPSTRRWADDHAAARALTIIGAALLQR
jgi:pyroglutamyl-peptidase